MRDFNAQQAQKVANAREWLRRAYVEEEKLIGDKGYTLTERIEIVHRIDALRDKAFEELALIPMHVGKVHACREKLAA